jgi:single-strand DNA-binding protein
MLSTELIGNLGKDCEVKDLDSGRVMITYSVAAEIGKDKTVWVSCRTYRDRDKSRIADYLKKGTKVFLRGLPEANAWVDRDGNARSDLQLIASEVKLLSKAE